jgi:hypothetical protein
MTAVTVRAACRRFACSHNHCRHISRLTPGESSNLHGAAFAVMEGSTIRDTGDLAALDRWCREAGVLAATERLV